MNIHEAKLKALSASVGEEHIATAEKLVKIASEMAMTTAFPLESTLNNLLVVCGLLESQKSRDFMLQLEPRIKFFFAWYDMWIGGFYNKKKHYLYICPLPCCVIRIKIK